ncbi:hypothetical protein [Nonomuraea wenchangensis]|uniref:hypothetical protein n=1 Tax=Nonomuraea wenchangensis TaxID=568860 RepID=UPI0034217550
MFPDSMSDQAILAYGRELCRAKDRDEQEAILTRAGSARPSWGVDPWDLVHVCPEIIGATHPELLRSTEETQAANDAYVAEENAKCRDPWPRRTAGWQEVEEVPIVSRTGRLTVPEMDGDEVGAGAPMPNLAIKGKGRYRLRVYVRTDAAGEEQHLVVVFPGTSKKRLTLKP